MVHFSRSFLLPEINRDKQDFRSRKAFFKLSYPFHRRLQRDCLLADKLFRSPCPIWDAAGGGVETTDFKKFLFARGIVQQVKGGKVNSKN
jgi:hypothetical protein